MNSKILFFLFLAIINQFIFVSAGNTIYVKNSDIHHAIKMASDGYTIIANSNTEIEIKKTIVIDKSITLIGLRAKMHPDFKESPLLKITADDVRISDFHLIGNSKSVSRDKKRDADLILVGGNNFIIERGLVKNSVANGIKVKPTLSNKLDITSGLIQDITSHNINRDHISLEGNSESGLKIRNVIVQRIKAYNSIGRGAVEISDGTENISVFDIYAENCLYGVDVQDHNLYEKAVETADQANTEIKISNIYVSGCTHLIRTSNSHKVNHRGLTVRNIGGHNWKKTKEFAIVPIQISNTKNIVLDTIRIEDANENVNNGNINNIIRITNCTNVMVESVYFGGSTSDETILLENSDVVTINNIYLDSNAINSNQVALRYKIQKIRNFEYVRIDNFIVRGLANKMILDSLNLDIRLQNYFINYNPDLIEIRLVE